MDELGEWRQLQYRGADAAVSHEFARCAASNADRALVDRLNTIRGFAAGVAMRRIRPSVPRRARNRSLTAIPEPRRRRPAVALESCHRERGVAPEIINHYNVQPVFDVYANVDRRDLGSVGSDVEKIVNEIEPKLPRGSCIEIRGQVETMENFLLPAGPRHDLRCRSGLFADGGEFPVVARSVHYSDGAARGSRRDPLDAVCHADHVQRAFPDGRDHVYWRSHCEQHPAGDICERSAPRRHG